MAEISLSLAERDEPLCFCKFAEKVFVVCSRNQTSAVGKCFGMFVFCQLNISKERISMNTGNALIAEVFDNDEFWRAICKERPNVIGLRESKLIWFDKQA